MLMLELRFLLVLAAGLTAQAFYQNPAILAKSYPSSVSIACPKRQLRCVDVSMELANEKGGHANSFGRREMMSILPAVLVLGPLAARSETSSMGAGTAAMGADLLDRPEFRRYQDLTKDEAYVPGSDGSAGLQDITIPINGKQRKLGKLLGKGATIVMNVKLDDPETTTQIPSLRSVMAQFAGQGLTAICFPTDQGDYEPDDSTTLAQQFGLASSSKGPVVVTDKTDIVGRFAHPLYKYMTTSAPNPNNVSRITLNYEKFLLGPDGKVVRRYPRKWPADRMAKDIEAVLAGKPLARADEQLTFAWAEADKEATRSMYSFRKHYNFYDQEEAGVDWAGTKSEIFTAGSVEARFKRFSKGKPLAVPLPD